MQDHTEIHSIFFHFYFILFLYHFASLHMYCTYIQFIEDEGTKGILTTVSVGWPKAIQQGESRENTKMQHTSFSFWPTLTHSI